MEYGDTENQGSFCVIFAGYSVIGRSVYQKLNDLKIKP